MASIEVFQSNILSWYKEHKRDLPWRRTHDPYAILVSEIMLQQTQVDRVIPKYLSFLQSFPNAKSLADAKTGDVIVHWSGLGFNRRAINLQKAAAAVTEQGSFPTTRDTLLELPGVGPYTAGAILAFAYNKKSSVIDTNIRRIISRYFLAGGTVAEVDNLAFASVPSEFARDWNNALMDFGSMVCLAGSPKCELCPLARSCRANKESKQNAFLKIGKPQSKFKGSRREFRGKVLKFLKKEPKHTSSIKAITEILEKDKEFTISILKELEADGLIVYDKDVSLP